MTRRIVVAGTKAFEDYELLKRVLDKMVPDASADVEIVSGHAEGTDMFGEQYAAERGIKCKVIPADWKGLGRKAGPIRNTWMLDYASEEEPEVIAFWNGTSKGTVDTIRKAKKLGIKCTVILYDSESSVRFVMEKPEGLSDL